MLDSIIRFSVHQRIVILAIVLAVAGLGIYNFNRLTIDAVPDITNVQVIVLTEATGYTPLEVEQRISFPLETAMSGLPSLDYTRSISRYGLSQITVVFNEGTDIYFARQQVTERLTAAQAQLPPGIEPALGPTATGLGEIFMFTVDAAPEATMPDGSPVTPTDLRSVHDWIIRPQLLRVPGVVEVNPIGGQNKQIVVAPDPAMLLAHGLTFDMLLEKIAANNSNRGAGFIERNGAQQLVRVPGQATDMEALERIVVSQSDGVPVHLGDVASVSVGAELRSGAATQNGREVVLSTVFMLIGENSREVAQAVAERLEVVKESLPEGIEVATAYNRTNLVNQTLKTVQKNLLEGALLVVVVLFLLLGNIRAALLTAAVIPAAMLMTITGMVENQVSANLMSLGALDFGLIVDGAVIIVENCMRRLSVASEERSERLPLSERLDLVIEATREVIRPALFGVFIITAVYLPIFSLTGVEGKMFHPMAFTVVIALVSAMILSLTFVPACVALLFRKPVKEGRNPIMHGAKVAYAPLLRFALKGRYILVPAAAILVVACIGLATRMGSEFLPNLDEGDIAMHALRIPGTSLSQAVSLQEQLENRIKELPEVERVFAKIGTADVATDAVPPSVADNFIMLKPRSEWPDPGKPKAQVVADLEAAVTPIPGNRYEFLQPIQMRFNELIAGVRAELAIKIFGDDFDTLVELGDAMEETLGTVPGAVDIQVEQATGLPVLTVHPRLERLSRLGLSIDDVQDVVATAVGGSEAGVFYDGDRRHAIVVRMAETTRADTDALANLPVALPGGGFTPLSEIVDFELALGLNQIKRENGKRHVIVTANVRGRDLGSFVADVQAAVADLSLIHISEPTRPY